ncbi:TerC family protein [Ehrlichia ruminantium]|uniref:TerC family protein n=1 Tax=Ehrlichia ruminantium TaxID=779 RepID=A0AAE6QBC4_EHRRU|nr:TerC family protein [Ehrlichia ruminantium]QGR02535.1 TerC family protein [Ehrlichia ruminantium]QGR03456.1 TerC family protein [Ehrlichia ruminantium]QGR04381.1 TerC family protein [Ehrlichia ruminantium]
MFENDILKFFTLLLLEIILGIDNVIFISLAVIKVPLNLRNKVKYIGLALALVMRLIALHAASILLSLNKPIVSLLQLHLSPNNLFMIFGGGFLIYHSISEILDDVFNKTHNKNIHNLRSNPYLVILQLILIDLVFSIDSILTAIGITYNIFIIQLVFIISIILTILFSNQIIKAITTYSNIKTIAVMFVLMLGIILVLDGIHIKISHNYLYFTFIFSILTEIINIIKKVK